MSKLLEAVEAIEGVARSLPFDDDIQIRQHLATIRAEAAEWGVLGEINADLRRIGREDDERRARLGLDTDPIARAKALLQSWGARLGEPEMRDIQSLIDYAMRIQSEAERLRGVNADIDSALTAAGEKAFQLTDRIRALEAELARLSEEHALRNKVVMTLQERHAELRRKIESLPLHNQRVGPA